MDAVLKVRSEIYDQFHRSSAGPDYFFKAAKLLTRDEASQSDGRELRQAAGAGAAVAVTIGDEVSGACRGDKVA